MQAVYTRSTQRGRVSAAARGIAVALVLLVGIILAAISGISFYSAAAAENADAPMIAFAVLLAADLVLEGLLMLGRFISLQAKAGSFASGPAVSYIRWMEAFADLSSMACVDPRLAHDMCRNIQ